ncbi:MAG: DUF4465 domain-containing protein [Verrucomicrobiia bacterium]
MNLGLPLRALACITLLLNTPHARALLVDFSDLSLPSDSFYNGGPVTNTDGWTSNTVFFGNSYDSSFGGFWNGFAYSNVNDTTTPGFGNQYAAFTGTAYSGSIYAIAYEGSHAFINLPTGYTASSIRVTNTTYAALDMTDGSFFSKKFGGTSGDDPDFFDVIFTGYDALDGTGSVTGSVTFRLADFTFTDNSLDYIVNTWEFVDLTPLGSALSLRITFDSSDVGPFGINTPTYVALDQLELIPEPSSLALLLLALGLIAFTSRRRLLHQKP